MVQYAAPCSSPPAPAKWLALVLLLVASCSSSNPSLQITGPTMGTSYSITIPHRPSGISASKLESTVKTLLQDINLKMSTYIADSELSLINLSASDSWLTVSPELYEILTTARQVSAQTDGAFDISVGALVELWGFGPTPPRQDIPVPEEIALALSTTGNKQFELSPVTTSVRKLNSATRLDLSAIAKGYAVDRVADLLEQNRILDYMVEIGGEIRSMGRNHKGESWRVGIEKPVTDQRTVHSIIILTDQAMATSGDYRNFFNHAGKRYSHEIDPRTGWPVSHKLRSVTVVHDLAMMADALATALMVMGPELAPVFAEKENIAALFIISSGSDFIEQHTSRFVPNLVK